MPYVSASIYGAVLVYLAPASAQPLDSRPPPRALQAPSVVARTGYVTSEVARRARASENGVYIYKGGAPVYRGRFLKDLGLLAATG